MGFPAKLPVNVVNVMAPDKQKVVAHIDQLIEVIDKLIYSVSFGTTVGNQQVHDMLHALQLRMAHERLALPSKHDWDLAFAIQTVESTLPAGINPEEPGPYSF